MAIDFNADQNRMGLALLAAAGPSARPMSFGQRMFMGMGQHDQYLAEKEQREQLRKAREAQLAFQEMQMAQMIQQQAERKAAQERAAQDEGIARRLFGQPMQMGVPTSQIGPEMPERTGGMINPQTFLAQGGSLGGLGGVGALNQMMATPRRKPLITKPGDIARDEDTGEELWKNPEAPKEDADAAFLALVYGKDTPEYFAAMKDLAKKKTTHAPAATAISYGSPVPVQLSGGGVGYAQPGNRPGAAPQMMVGPDNKPLQKPPEPPKAMPEAATKQITGARNLRDAIANYKQQLQTFSMVDMLNPNERARMGNAYNNMMLQAKEAYNLGVLNGPDYTILQSVVQDPTNMRSAIVSNKALASQATELSRIASGIEKRALEAHGKTYKPGEDDNDPLGLRGGR
ncbi:MAG: hypothetical protein IPG77_01760 [Betaproteobacteria bacterium]|nr:hypothetical protein [Betaproteobacteria bacterium]